MTLRKKKVSKKVNKKKITKKRKRNPSFIENNYYEIETKDDTIIRGKVLESDVTDSTGKHFVILEQFARDEELPVSFNYIKKSKPISQLDYYYKNSFERKGRK